MSHIKPTVNEISYEDRLIVAMSDYGMGNRLYTEETPEVEATNTVTMDDAGVPKYQNQLTEAQLKFIQQTNSIAEQVHARFKDQGYED